MLNTTRLTRKYIPHVIMPRNSKQASMSSIECLEVQATGECHVKTQAGLKIDYTVKTL